MRPPGDSPEDSGGIQQSITAYIQQLEAPPEEILEMEYVFDALAHPRRRYLLYSLLADPEWTLTELATKLTAWEQDIHENAVTDYDRDRIYVSLYHTHIPILVDHNVIDFEDGEVGVIQPAENSVQVLAVLQGMGASLDTAQETHARRDYDGA